jgi:hypothetical protein
MGPFFSVVLASEPCGSIYLLLAQPGGIVPDTPTPLDQKPTS